MIMIHYSCLKDKCFRTADTDKAFVLLSRNVTRNIKKNCNIEQKIKQFDE